MLWLKTSAIAQPRHILNGTSILATSKNLVLLGLYDATASRVHWQCQIQTLTMVILTMSSKVVGAPPPLRAQKLTGNVQVYGWPYQTKPKNQILFWSETLVWAEHREGILCVAWMQEE